MSEGRLFGAALTKRKLHSLPAQFPLPFFKRCVPLSELPVSIIKTDEGEAEEKVHILVVGKPNRYKAQADNQSHQTRTFLRNPFKVHRASIKQSLEAAASLCFCFFFRGF